MKYHVLEEAGARFAKLYVKYPNVFHFFFIFTFLAFLAIYSIFLMK